MRKNKTGVNLIMKYSLLCFASERPFQPKERVSTEANPQISTVKPSVI